MPERASELQGATLREGLTSRVFWIVVIVLFFSSIAQNGALTHMSALLTDRGVTASGGAIALSVMGAASLIGRLVTGWLLDRFFAGRVAFGLLTTAALGTFLLASAPSLTIGAVAAAMIGFGMGGEADVTPYVLVALFRLALVLDALRPDLDVLRRRRRCRTGVDGPGVRRHRLVRGPATRLALGTLAVAALMLFLPRYPAISVLDRV